MAIYAIGDLQGCYKDLLELLNKINFKSEKDTLWFVGDLVNRGPDSLSTLRFVKDLGQSAQTVLGNHDLHLLAIHQGIRKNNDSDIQKIIDAPDCEDLMQWLRQQPLLHYDAQSQFTMVHAGIYPHWTLDQAKEYANELETILSSEQYPEFFKNMYGNSPDQWQESLSGWDRIRFICNSFTRMRYCHPNGQLDFTFNGAPGSEENDLIPWFNLQSRCTENNKIIFGHWSTLGYFKKQNNLTLPKNIYATDTGCVWGGQLTALNIDNPTETISIDCPKRATP